MKNPPLIPITAAAFTARQPHGKEAFNFVKPVFVEGVRAVAAVKADTPDVYFAAAMEVASVQDGIVFWRNISSFCDEWSMLFSWNEIVQKVSFDGEIAIPAEALVITKPPEDNARQVRNYVLARIPMLKDANLDTIAGVVGRLILEVDPEGAQKEESLTDGQDHTSTIGVAALCEGVYETTHGRFQLSLCGVDDSIETDRYLVKKLLGEDVSFQIAMDRDYPNDDGTGRTLIARFEDWIIGLNVTSGRQSDEGGNADVHLTFFTGPDAALDALLCNWVREEAAEVGRELAMNIGTCDAQALQAMTDAVLETLRQKGALLDALESA